MDRAGKSPIDFKKFFEEFFPAVYALMRKYTQEDEVAWDLAQDAFLKLWDKWDEFAGEENAKAFVYTVAKNLFVNYRNREKLKAEVYANLEIDEVDDNNYLKEIMAIETKCLLYAAIDQLPPQTRTIILLNLAGKNNTEIAEDLSISVNTVKSLKKAAYQTLRSLLAKDYWWIIFLNFYL